MFSDPRPTRFGPYCLHPTQGLTRGTREVRLTPKSLAVLGALTGRSGQVVTKEELHRAIWPDTIVSDAALSSCILELRHALGDDARQPRYIETLRRRGFRFVARCTTDLPDASETIPQTGRLGTGAPGLIVGRDQALEQLSRALARAREGVRQVVFVTGEAGIGKTAVVDAFLAGISDNEPWRISRVACIEHAARGEAYQPLLEALTRLCRQPGGESVLAVMRRFAPAWLAQLPAVQTPAELRAVQRRTAGTTTERLRRELTDALEALSMQTPLVLHLDDLHWSDPSTLEWVTAFARRRERAPVLLVASYRQEEENGNGLLAENVTDLSVRQACSIVRLEALDERAVMQYVMRRLPAAPGAGASLERVARRIHAHTEGNPLFVVTLLDDLIARGVLMCRDQRWSASPDLDWDSLGVPADIGRTIQHRIDRLTAVDRRILEVASAIGQRFASATVAAGAALPVEDVEATLDARARRGDFVRRGPADTWPDGTVSATFQFIHGLHRAVLLEQVAPARRARLHRLIGTRLEVGYGDRASEIAAELAAHFELAGDPQRAVVYLQLAGDVDRLRSAHPSAEQHYRRALDQIGDLPPSAERDAREAILRIALGGELAATQGLATAEVEASYAHALELHRQAKAPARFFSVLWGLWVFHLTRGPLGTARELADRLLALAQQTPELRPLLEAHHAVGITAFMLGDLGTAQAQASRGLALCGANTDGGLAMTYGCTLHDAHLTTHHTGVCGALFSAWVDALAGRPATAERSLDAAVAHARDLAHPYTLALSLVLAAGALHVSRNADAAWQRAAEAAAIADEHDFRILRAWASIYEGCALAGLGDSDQGLTRIREGLGASRDACLSLFQPFQLGLAADAHLRSGRLEECAQNLEAALGISDRVGDRLWLAELHRIKGELRLATSSDCASRLAAEQDFRAALAISRAQGATLLALRASRDLAQLLAGTPQGAEALTVLATIRDEVPEARDLPDGAEATALMGQLR
jgi:DNA-binding winged helix-turn-helix (wHTH) protein